MDQTIDQIIETLPTGIYTFEQYIDQRIIIVTAIIEKVRNEYTFWEYEARLDELIKLKLEYNKLTNTNNGTI